MLVQFIVGMRLNKLLISIGTKVKKESVKFLKRSYKNIKFPNINESL